MFDFSAERTLQSVDESLARLGLEYVDVIQVGFMCLKLKCLGSCPEIAKLISSFVKIRSFDYPSALRGLSDCKFL